MRGYERECTRQGQTGLSHLWLGCPGQHRVGRKVGAKDALIHSTCCVSSPVVPPCLHPGLRFLVENRWGFFIFIFFE